MYIHTYVCIHELINSLIALKNTFHYTSALWLTEIITGKYMNTIMKITN